MPEPRHEVWYENYMLIYGDEDTMFDTWDSRLGEPWDSGAEYSYKENGRYDQDYLDYYARYHLNWKEDSKDRITERYLLTVTLSGKNIDGDKQFQFVVMKINDEWYIIAAAWYNEGRYW